MIATAIMHIGVRLRKEPNLSFNVNEDCRYDFLGTETQMKNDDSNSMFRKEQSKGIVHIKSNYNKDDSYYPKECYIEDFEIEKMNTLKILEDFKPIDADN